LAQDIGLEPFEHFMAVNNPPVINLGAHIDVFGKAFGHAIGREPGRHGSNTQNGLLADLGLVVTSSGFQPFPATVLDLENLVANKVFIRIKVARRTYRVRYASRTLKNTLPISAI
jgi:hypothetical protein